MAVRSAHSQGADGGPGIGWKLLQLTADRESSAGQVDKRVRRGEVGLGIYLSTAYHQHGLDQPYDAGGRVEMSIAGLQRAEVAGTVEVRPRVVDTGDGAELDGITQLCSGPVR